jgi:hypothetical protein
MTEKSNCSHFESCELFPHFSKHALLRVWQINYCCADDFERCARYEKALKGEAIPITLLPNGKTLPVLNKLGEATK